MLEEIGKNLPKLISINVRPLINAPLYVITFLTFMPQLEHIRLHVINHSRFNFENLSNPRLKQLELVKEYYINLKQYLEKAPLIEQIIMKECWINSWSELLDPVEQSSALHTLRLTTVGAKIQNDWFSKRTTAHNLIHLELQNCNASRPTLINLFKACPRVRVLYLKSDTVDDVVVLEMCHRLPQLAHLTLESGSITDASADYLLKQNDTLQTLRIVAPWEKFSLAARDKLAASGRFPAPRSYY